MQVNTRHNQDEEAILRGVLRTIASNTDTASCAQLIVQAAHEMFGAASGCFILFAAPRLRVDVGGAAGWEGHDDALFEAADRLREGIHFNPKLPGELIQSYSAWLVVPIRLNQQLVGGLWLWFDAPYEPTSDGDALLMALVDALTIVVARAQEQDFYERERQLTASVLNSIADPLLVIDSDRRVLLMNPAAERVFSTSNLEAVGKPLREVVQADELVAFAEKHKPLSEWIPEEEKAYVPHLQPVVDDNGAPQGWVLALRDISRFKKLIRNQNEFVRIVSHDLRSPLTSMQGFASMLTMVGEVNDRQNQFVEKILSGIAQITALVDNIQDAGRYDPETGFYEMSRSQCDLGDVVNKIVNNHLVPAEKQELTITISIADDVPIINADANMLERSITNLVDNAIKYTPNGGEIKIFVKVVDNNVLIGVRDTGLGISAENQKLLFQRHVRLAREEHKRIKGSGLGLFIVRSVAQRHGGDAWVESVEGKGSTFYMRIPLEGANLVMGE